MSWTAVVSRGGRRQSGLQWVARRMYSCSLCCLKASLGTPEASGLVFELWNSALTGLPPALRVGSEAARMQSLETRADD